MNEESTVFLPHSWRKQGSYGAA